MTDNKTRLVTPTSDDKTIAHAVQEHKKLADIVGYEKDIENLLRKNLELMRELEEVKANADYQIEGRELEKKELLGIIQEKDKAIAELKAKIEKSEKWFHCACDDIRSIQNENIKNNDRIKELEEYSENGKKMITEYIELARNFEQENNRLKEQIEKMKCCGNCNHFDKLYNRCELSRLTLKSCLCVALEKWELRR